MRRKIITNIVFTIIIIILLYAILKISYKNNYFKKLIGINLPKDSIVLKSEDTHGGFHGDGELFIEVQLTDKGSVEFVNNTKNTGKWTSLPLPKDLTAMLYGGEFNGIIHDENNMFKAVPKDINKGSYYFRDRFAERYPESKDKSIFDRGSYNFTGAILDLNTNKLYIYELDT
ncbi:hypothetical protein HMPREF1982_00177 [Clostridiales bacterium oral taxon 876 str. F0540]|nr:hypothetical protein HMPREF1982_00177 [Clostridiales bacterium oral taxon 876 str. F0540]